jgi:hypothetical protein
MTQNEMGAMPQRTKREKVPENTPFSYATMTKKRLLAPMFGLRRITGYTEVTLFAELLRALLRNEIAVTKAPGISRNQNV